MTAPHEYLREARRKIQLAFTAKDDDLLLRAHLLEAARSGLVLCVEYSAADSPKSLQIVSDAQDLIKTISEHLLSIAPQLSLLGYIPKNPNERECKDKRKAQIDYLLSLVPKTPPEPFS